MTEKQIKSILAKTAIKYGIPPAEFEALAWVEYARLYGWTDEHIKQYHSDGTSFGLFGLRVETSVEEWRQRKGYTRDQASAMLKTVKGQAECAGWYYGKRIPEMIKHYELENSRMNRIVSYNAGISRAISGEVPEITSQYIKTVDTYTKENNQTVPFSWLVAPVAVALAFYHFM